MSFNRILHCGKSLDNYYICINEKVAGFTQRFRDGGTEDVIYIAVKVGKTSLCGARGVLKDVTDNKPWEDADKYMQSFKIDNIEYCTPFDLAILREVDKYWSVKYLVGSKIIRESKAVETLENEFNKNKIDKLHIFEEYLKENEEDVIQDIEDNPYIENDEEKLDILGTFQTVRFKNETDPIRGLEPLVTEYFYDLFKFFKRENSVLISNNRLFSTSGLKNDNNENILGIKGIPDALLLTFNKDSSNTSLKINLIEYECYGDMKYRNTQKFEYFNGHIIPQLMRFASTFSIVTDYKIRENTINEWINKIIDYIDRDKDLMDKIDSWMLQLNPNIRPRDINISLLSELKKAFETNIKIILIIDELTIEQKETISNVVKSFKLNNVTTKGKSNCIDFTSYIVRLEQKVGVCDKNANFALSYQE